MGNIIWIWRFPHHWTEQLSNDGQTIIDIDQGVYGDNVVLFQQKVADNTMFQEEWLTFREKVEAIIETIINLWVQDYLSITKQEVFGRDFFKEVEFMNKKMLNDVDAVKDTLDYVEELYGDSFDEEFLLNALWEVLHKHRQSVLAILLRNEKIKGG